MLKKWQNICGFIKEEDLFLRALLVGLVLMLSFWGIAFPQYLFNSDCVKIFRADGREMTDHEREHENLYREISTAKPEQIEVRIGILEWAKR